jgi:hypothetical protein
VTISRDLRVYGLVSAARLVSEATDAPSEILALRFALAAIEGASMVLRTHARALRNTSAAYERGRLRGLEADIVVRLGALLRRPVDGAAEARS